MNFEKILKTSPAIEVLIRYAYWTSPFLREFLEKRKKILYKNSKNKEKQGFINFDKILEKLSMEGINSGEIIILHSAYSSLSDTGLSPLEICKKILTLLGPTGTLAAPAIPKFHNSPIGIDILSNSICEQLTTYDVINTPPWTGAIPAALMKIPGARRSRHPLNTMVAVGSEAENMMHHNIDGDLPLACGPQSSWKYCLDKNAKLVFIGADVAHSITMIHVAEDCYSSEWPIKNWYRDRRFLVIDNDFKKEIKVKERHPKWAINYAERTLAQDLLKHKIVKEFIIENVNISICESQNLINFLSDRRKTGYPYFYTSLNTK